MTDRPDHRFEAGLTIDLTTGLTIRKPCKNTGQTPIFGRSRWEGHRGGGGEERYLVKLSSLT